ncbi:tRNA lysidine(34) synthetase TilS [Geothrix sp. PMB-07]|uniref:tRNA lysidine(34) synthetase TilS n=1 Tax=Geothrix sp. PMB-07 TaxID=3068640 RepID=UPI002740C525|nr:tRNA lysidine(34) synthetase TilS [Geothrix sp. PMB-07]WLT33312.1 tRNA lysidine(34) synthetase TilS [Geothrix sp. PMB-07]
MNRFEADLLAQIQRRGDNVSGRVLVACSGGGDSVALLVLLWSLRRSLGLELSVAHADHGLRPESPEDADFVRQLCRALDLDLAEASLGVRAHAETQRIGLEMAARELRWDWLRQEAQQCGASTVATGHTLDDHSETVLLRLARGGGLGSLHPLAPRQNLRWSPLIELRRANLRGYLVSRNLPWREDATNAEPFTARNRWRPLLEDLRQEAPELDRHLFETHLQAAEAEGLAHALIASWEGSRWRMEGNGIALKQEAWTEPEVRWTLDTAFRRLDWPREASLLRGLAPWLSKRLMQGGKPASWGNFHLNPEPSDGYLHLRQGPLPSRTE